eukprot:8295986-Pyramimonas_sp.AAC.1
MQFASFGCEMHWRCVQYVAADALAVRSRMEGQRRSICIGVAALTVLIGASGSGFFQMHDALAMRINAPR